MVAVTLVFSGCGKLPDWIPGNKNPERAEAAQAKGNYSEAVNIYESLLDGTKSSADIHRRLAVIYDSKLKDPISALHHYRRYLALQSGEASSEIKSAASRLERDLGRKYTATASTSVKVAATPAPSGKAPVDAKGFSTVPKTAAAEQLVGQETKTYKVVKGDTIAAISRKFYKTPDRWKDIVDANYNQLNGSPNIREGQTLIIP